MDSWARYYVAVGACSVVAAMVAGVAFRGVEVVVSALWGLV